MSTVSRRRSQHTAARGWAEWEPLHDEAWSWSWLDVGHCSKHRAAASVGRQPKRFPAAARPLTNAQLVVMRLLFSCRWCCCRCLRSTSSCGTAAAVNRRLHTQSRTSSAAGKGRRLLGRQHGQQHRGEVWLVTRLSCCCRGGCLGCCPLCWRRCHWCWHRRSTCRPSSSGREHLWCCLSGCRCRCRCRCLRGSEGVSQGR